MNPMSERPPDQATAREMRTWAGLEEQQKWLRFEIITKEIARKMVANAPGLRWIDVDYKRRTEIAEEVNAKTVEEGIGAVKDGAIFWRMPKAIASIKSAAASKKVQPDLDSAAILRESRAGSAVRGDAGAVGERPYDPVRDV